MELRQTTTARRAFLVTLLALCAVIPASCTTINLTVPTVATQPTVPGGYLLDTDGTVTVGVPSLPSNFNPGTVAGDNRITQMVMEQVWPQPFITDPTFNLETSSLLVRAEVEGIAPFRVVYVVNPEAVWSDGTPITSADFSYLWQERLHESADLPDAGLVAGYRDIQSVTGADGGRTVTVTFSRPFSEWQSLFGDLVPAHIAERYGWAKAFAGYSPARLVSGGPFEVSAFSPGRSLTLSRNPRYWGVPAHIAHIRFVVETSATALLRALDSGQVSIGELDSSSYSPGRFDGGLIARPSIRSGSRRGRRPATKALAAKPGTLEWSAYAGGQIWQICFNELDPLASQLSLRQAIVHSLDRSEIVADSEDLIDPKIGVALSRFTLTGESANPSSPGTTPISEHAPVLYKPVEALRLFADAGYLVGAGGLLRPDGFGAPLRLRLLEPSDSWAVDQAGLVVQAELRAIGVTVTLVEEPLATMLTRALPRGEYQLALAPFAISTAVAAVAPEYSDSVLPVTGSPVASGRGTAVARTTATQAWSTSVAVGTDPGAAAAGGVTRDVLGVDDSLIAKRLADALQELNPPQALAALQRADSRMWNQADSVPLFQAGSDLIHAVRVDNVSESPTWAGIMWDAEDWAILKQPPTTTTTTGTTTTTSAG